MPEFISRHDASLSAYRSKIKESNETRSEQVDLLELNSSVTHLVLASVRLDAYMNLAMDPASHKAETWESWTTFSEVAEAVFAISQTPEGKKIKRVINGKERILEGTGPSYSANAKNWLDAFFLALTCRDQDRASFLCKVPMASMREAADAGGARYHEFIYPWISALQDYILDRPQLTENLIGSFQLSSPSGSGPQGREFLDSIAFPQINAFYRIIEHNTEDFNRALAQGFQKFHSYQTATEERKRTSTE